MSRKSLIDLIGLALIALVVILGYRLSPLLLPAADLTVQPDAACDLHRQACNVVLPGGGRLSLSMAPRPIPLMTPFRIEVSLNGLEVQSIEVDFAGVDMNMGFNRFTLRDEGQGKYAAEARIPVCVTGRMAWQATVMLVSGRQHIAVPFRFSSGENAS